MKWVLYQVVSRKAISNRSLYRQCSFIFLKGYLDAQKQVVMQAIQRVIEAGQLQVDDRH